MTYQLIVECNNYCGMRSDRRCHAIQGYLKQKITNIDSVKMIESEVLQNLIRPQVIVRCEDNHPKTLLENLDKTLLEIGLYAIRALVVRVATRAVEGIMLGGGLAALFESKKEQKYLSMLIGALVGGAVGNLIEKGTLELVANKELSGWVIEGFTT